MDRTARPPGVQGVRPAGRPQSWPKGQGKPARTTEILQVHVSRWIYICSLPVTQRQDAHAVNMGAASGSTETSNGLLVNMVVLAVGEGKAVHPRISPGHERHRVQLYGVRQAVRRLAPSGQGQQPARHGASPKVVPMAGPFAATWLLPRLAVLPAIHPLSPRPYARRTLPWHGSIPCDCCSTSSTRGIRTTPSRLRPRLRHPTLADPIPGCLRSPVAPALAHAIHTRVRSASSASSISSPRPTPAHPGHLPARPRHLQLHGEPHSAAAAVNVAPLLYGSTVSGRRRPSGGRLPCGPVVRLGRARRRRRCHVSYYGRVDQVVLLLLRLRLLLGAPVARTGLLLLLSPCGLPVAPRAGLACLQVLKEGSDGGAVVVPHRLRVRGRGSEVGVQEFRFVCAARVCVHCAVLSCAGMKRATCRILILSAESVY